VPLPYRNETNPVSKFQLLQLSFSIITIHTFICFQIVGL